MITWIYKTRMNLKFPGEFVMYEPVIKGKFRAQKKGKLLSSHRSTIYPCFVPNLGDLTGAGRERLTRRKSI
jgi:hypothetical protein